MEEAWIRIIENLGERVTGPMKLRLLIQPAMAIFFAVKAGLLDARMGKLPYAWALFTHPEHRHDLIKDGWRDVSKIFALALVLDAIYQWVASKLIYPGEMVLVAIGLAILPYLFVRGLVTRFNRRNQPHAPSA